MRISAGSDDSQYFSYISKENKINNKVKASEVEVTGIQLSSGSVPSDINTIQEANKAIMRLMQNIGTASESLSGPQLPMFHADLEEITVALVERVNEVLEIINKANNAGITPDKSTQTDKNGLEQLREIISSGMKIQESMNIDYQDFSSLGIKIMYDGLLNVDQKTLKEAISSSGGEVARVIKTVANTLFETLPLCIDPNSGALLYTGKRLEDRGDDKASKVLAAMREDLEKERAEIEKRLNIAELLISYSNSLIDDLMPSSEALYGDA